MTDYTDLKTDIRDWIGLQSPTDATINGWIKMIERRVNTEMRVKEMVTQSSATISAGEFILPPDWIETEYIRYISSVGANQPDVKYGRPLLQKTIDNFAEAVNDPCHPDHLKSFYSIVGSNVLINPNANVGVGIQLEIGYYAKVPSIITNGTNWLFSNYYDILLYGALAHAGAKLVEDDRVPLWEARVTKSINDANDAWRRSKTSGGPLIPRFRSFG